MIKEFLNLVIMRLKTAKAYIASLIFFSVFFPIGLLLMMGSVARSSFSIYIIAGTITFYIAVSMINSVAQQIGYERETGRISLMISSGIPMQLSVLAIALCSGLQTIVVTPLMIFVGDAFLGITPLCIATLALTLLLSLVLGSMLGAFLAFLIRSVRAINQYSNILSFTLAFFAPVYYPPCVIPLPFRYLTYLEPTTYVSRAIYYSYLGQGLQALIWNLGIVIYSGVLIFGVTYLIKRQ
ncbi:ABC transporter permease [Acidianus sp. HS-5]|uniref:ABC transporter permease n=1 Tax=Acidianus sp. HS-5 TaxID=2886040 RepID=UPI001F1CA2D2|nr:ABC transporter permease [Acidianus sp. HS-5]BDC17904.1 multidrug ABC transporter ATP-binding protein [Acidianus sp. HS-5]